MANKNQTSVPSPASPTGGNRACLCKGTNTYSIKCCDGSLWAQGIGNITAIASEEI
jgi:hypothetical protein